MSDPERKALLEAIVYVTEEPLSVEQIAKGLEWPKEEVETLLAELVADCQRAERGVEVRAVAGGYRLSTKAEHHDAVRRFVKSLKPPLKLSLPALETLAVIAYKQPVTAPEILEIRGVSGPGVIKTLLDRKLITTAGRKQVIGRPILYKTTREFLLQFGLNDVSELPSLKEFEELSRAALGEEVVSEPTAPEDHSGVGDHLAPESRGDDPGGPGDGERPGSDGAGDQGGPGEGSHQG
jgi:segregation and condensation protein B